MAGHWHLSVLLKRFRLTNKLSGGINKHTAAIKYQFILATNERAGWHAYAQLSMLGLNPYSRAIYAILH